LQRAQRGFEERRSEPLTHGIFGGVMSIDVEDELVERLVRRMDRRDGAGPDRRFGVDAEGSSGLTTSL
jgi:hypothetical protein